MANIFQQYAQPARSVMDYQADYDNQDLRREQLGAARRSNEIADLTATQTRQSMAESASERNILRQLAAQYGGDEQGFIRALGASGSPGLMKMAGEREKSSLDRGKLKADTAKTDAETKAMHAKAKYEAADRLAQKIGMVNTPDDLQAYEEEGIGLGIFPAERRGYSLQMAQQMGGIEQWKAASAKAAAPVLEQFKTAAEMARAQLTADTSITTTGMTNATSRETNAATNAAGVENNKRTVGASLANASATRDAARITATGAREVAREQRTQATEMKLADDYRQQSKEFGESKSAHKQLSATLGSATTSPAATLAAATKFMKILDPGSVVRESELGMALAASGVLDRAMNYVSTLQSGQKLTPTQAKDFKNISDKMFVAAQQVQQAIDEDYKGKAKTYGLRPEMIVQNLGQNAKEVNFGDLK